MSPLKSFLGASDACFRLLRLEDPAKTRKVITLTLMQTKQFFFVAKKFAHARRAKAQRMGNYNLIHSFPLI